MLKDLLIVRREYEIRTISKNCLFEVFHVGIYLIDIHFIVDGNTCRQTIAVVTRFSVLITRQSLFDRFVTINLCDATNFCLFVSYEIGFNTNITMKGEWEVYEWEWIILSFYCRQRHHAYVIPMHRQCWQQPCTEIDRKPIPLLLNIIELNV